MKIFQKGFNFSQDGPGNRLVFHLQGCNMRCPWCSNPEGMAAIGGNDYSVAEILRECERSRAMFFSGGGVTFTGGEATLQFSELKEVLEGLKAKGIHTAIETNATCKNLPELSPFIDFFIMDFKHFDGEILKKVTGADLDLIKANFGVLVSLRKQLLVRIPLINRFNADSAEGFVRFFSEFDTSGVVFEFLPYHEYGKDKWKSPYKVENGFISKAQLEKFKTEFKKFNLKVIST